MSNRFYDMLYYGGLGTLTVLSVLIVAMKIAHADCLQMLF